MGRKWMLDVPPPLYVETDEEAAELLHMLLKKADIYPTEAIAFDTESNALKVPIKNRWDDKGNEVPDPKIAPGDPLDWVRDTVTFWSLSARMDREMQEDWDAYLEKWHPSWPKMPYARWCLHRHHFQVFIPFFENERVILATWNGKYDGHISWNSGVNCWVAEVRDLLCAASLYDENLQGKLGLKRRAEDWCGLHMTKYTDLFDRDAEGNKAIEFKTSLFDLPIDRVIDYASYDAYATLKCYEWLEKELNDIEIEPGHTMWQHFLGTEVPFTIVLWRMERRGMHIDLEKLSEIEPKIREELAKLEKDICRETGRYLNLRSPKQLVEYFFGAEYLGKQPDPAKPSMNYEPVKMTTRGGKMPSTDVDVMEELRNQGDPVAGMILRYRKVDKILGTYVTSLRAMATWHKDGRIHPTFNQYGARTGRLSTSGPNSQNFPRPDNDEFGIRSMFTAPPGYKLIVGDYGQLEMRIMAHFSQDRNMLRAIREGKDLHCFTVSLMHNISYDEVVAAVKQKDEDKSKMTDRQKWLVAQRQAAKVIGFGLLYGAGAQRTAGELGITEEEAQEKIDQYFAAFPGIQKYIKYTHARCAKYEYVETLVGRRRRLYDINNHNRQLRGMAERESVNSVIQGTAADITKEAMLNIEFDEELNRLGCWLINQIHDEVVIEVPEENAEAALAIIKHHMEFPFQGEEALCIPTPTDLHIVDNWAEAK